MAMSIDTYKFAEEVREAQRHNAVINNYVTPKTKGSKLQEFISRDNVREYHTALITKTFKNIEKPTQDVAKCLTSYENCLNEVTDFFVLCMQKQMIPTISSLCLWLGIGSDTLYTKAKNKQTFVGASIFSEAISICRAFTENGALDGSISPQVFSLLGKNYFGLHDNQEITLTPKADNSQVNTLNTMKVIQEQLTHEDKL